MKKKSQRNTGKARIVVILFLWILISSLNAQSGYPLLDTSGMVGYFDFLGDFSDSMGIHDDAEIFHAEISSDRYCHPSNAVLLKDSQSYLKIADHPSLDFVDSMSISFFLCLDSLPSGESRILSKSDPGSETGGSYWISILPGGDEINGAPWSFSFEDQNGELQEFIASWGMHVGKWLQYTVSFNGEKVIMYMGSEPVAVFQIEDCEIRPNDQPLWMGNSLGTGITGKLDELVFYDRVINEPDLRDYEIQSILWPDPIRFTIGVCMGDTVELISYAHGPFIQYRFMKEDVVLQDGESSVYKLPVYSETDFGEYRCVAYDCDESYVKYFDVNQEFALSDISIVNQPYFLSAYENSRLQIGLEVSGGSGSASYQWYRNGYPIHRTSPQFEITLLHTVDTGFYYCEIRDGCSLLYSDSIYVEITPNQSFQGIDTTGLVVFYPFNGTISDSTGNTYALHTNGVIQDAGIFGQPGHGLRFSGQESYLEIAQDTVLDLEDPFTLEFSIRIDTAPTEVEPLFRKATGETDTVGNYGVFITPDMHLIFALTGTDGTVYKHLSNDTLKPATWHLIDLVFNGQEMISVIDGAPEISLDLPGISVLSNDSSLVIGNEGNQSLAFVMDQFMIYNRAKEIDEISGNHYSYYPVIRSFGPSRTACIGDQIDIQVLAEGPFLRYTYLKEGVVLQEGDPGFIFRIRNEGDFGTYQCIVDNGYRSRELEFDVDEWLVEEGVYIFDLLREEIFLSEGDEYTMYFNASDWFQGLEYEMYHNGHQLIDNVRGAYTIEHATVDDAGEYYFVVINGCKRLVSDTLKVILEGDFQEPGEILGWDWTGSISGSGSSYFSSVATAPDGSFCMMGHFSGGLRVEEEEAFSSLNDDVFIVKYSYNGDFLWCRFLQGPSYKGKGDLEFDSEGNLYVSGSFRDSLHIGDQVLKNIQAQSGFLLKMDPDGNLIWIEEMNSPWMNCANLEIDDGDHLYLGGNFSGELHLFDRILQPEGMDPYAINMFVSKLDTSGNCLWVHQALIDDGFMIGQLVDMVLDTTGNPVINGTFTNSLDLGGGIILETMIEAPFLVKYDNEGNVCWGRTMETDFGFAEAFDVSVDQNNRIFITGMYLANMAFDSLHLEAREGAMEEIFLARFDADGLCTSLSSFGSLGEGGDIGVCYEPETDTTGYLLGLFGDTLVMGADTIIAEDVDGLGFSPNMFISRLDDEGIPMALKSAGVRSNPHFGEIHVTEDRRLYFAGFHEGISLDKGSAAEDSRMAFGAFRLGGIPEFDGPTFMAIRINSTICAGDSLEFHNCWYSDAGSYRLDVEHAAGTDTIFFLELDIKDCFPEGIESRKVEEYLVYPNPASDWIYISTQGIDPFDIRMYNASGQLFLEKKGRQMYELNVSGIEPGIYLLITSGSGKVETHKILIR